MVPRDVIGATVYASLSGVTEHQNLFNALRDYIPSLLGVDADQYRITRQDGADYGHLLLYYMAGQMRDGSIFWVCMAVGAMTQPPPDYLSVSRTVGRAFIQQAIEEGDFEE